MKSIIVIFILIVLVINTTGFISTEESKVSPIRKTLVNPSVTSQLETSQWPMYKHDSRNTARCDVDTSNNMGGELWKYFFERDSMHSTVIDKNGILYVPTWYNLHSVYPNGTKRWIIEHGDLFTYTPAVGEDGTIYFGTTKHFFAYYPNGTLKWELNKEKKFSGYPTIDSNGILYVGTEDGYLYAINSNGSLKWEYYVGKYDYILAPAADNEGNIYFTTIYTSSLYCLYPNGTLNWKYKDYEFDYGPVIGDDGTIYVVPIHDIIAVNPNGTLKWKVYMDDWGGHPSLAPDGTIIISGAVTDYVTAIDPVDGSIIWKYLVVNSINFIRKSEAVIDSNGIIYFAYSLQDVIGYLCALTPDGSLKWETHLTSDIQPYIHSTIFSEPCISSDGTVYITTTFDEGATVGLYGYLHAIGKQNPISAPEAPIITGETKGRIGKKYEYTLQAVSPTGDDVYYFIEWDDYNYEKWFGPYPSGFKVKVSHSWNKEGTYNITARAKSGDGLCGPWGELKVTMPRDKSILNSPLLKFLERYPLLNLLLQRLAT